MGSLCATLGDAMQPMAEDWDRAVAVVAHPDDLEYGVAAAVARWTGAGRQVAYVLATSGEAGIEGMAPDVVGPLREPGLAEPLDIPPSDPAPSDPAPSDPAPS